MKCLEGIGTIDGALSISNENILDSKSLQHFELCVCVVWVGV